MTDEAPADMSSMSWTERVQSVLTMATTSLRADPRRTMASVVLDLGVGLAGPFTAVGTGMLVDATIRGDRGALQVAVTVLGAAAGIVLGLSLVADRVRIRLEENVAHHVETQVMEMVTSLPTVAHHENPAHLYASTACSRSRG